MSGVAAGCPWGRRSGAGSGRWWGRPGWPPVGPPVGPDVGPLVGPEVGPGGIGSPIGPGTMVGWGCDVGWDVCVADGPASPGAWWGRCGNATNCVVVGRVSTVVKTLLRRSALAMPITFATYALLWL